MVNCAKLEDHSQRELRSATDVSEASFSIGRLRQPSTEELIICSMLEGALSNIGIFQLGKVGEALRALCLHHSSDETLKLVRKDFRLIGVFLEGIAQISLRCEQPLAP